MEASVWLLLSHRVCFTKALPQFAISAAQSDQEKEGKKEIPLMTDYMVQ